MMAGEETGAFIEETTGGDLPCRKHDDNDVGNDDEVFALPPEVRNGPRVTAELERRELLEASDFEKAEAQLDLRGRPSSGGCVDLALFDFFLTAVELEVGKIPINEKRALLRAHRAFPFLFASTLHVRPFLEAEGYDIQRTARRIVKYWESREQLLGKGAFSPETFGSPTEDDYVRLYDHGITPGVDPAARAIAAEKLSVWHRGKYEAMEREIKAMPHKQKCVFLDLRRRKPDKVATDDQKTIFLRSVEHDPIRAAKRIVAYWEMKCYLFGREGALKDVTLSTLKEDFPQELAEGIIYMLPDGDAFGRGLIMNRADKYPVDEAGQNRLVSNVCFDAVTVEQYSHMHSSFVHLCMNTFDGMNRFDKWAQLKLFWYVLHVAVSDGDSYVNGFVFINYLRGFGPKQVGFKFVCRLMHLLRDCMPLQMRALHDCFPPGGRWFQNVFLPFIKWLHMKKLRMRHLVHYGGVGEVLASLESCGIRKEQLPNVLGGSLEEGYPDAWLEGLRSQWQ